MSTSQPKAAKRAGLAFAVLTSAALFGGLALSGGSVADASATPSIPIPPPGTAAQNSPSGTSLKPTATFRQVIDNSAAAQGLR
jgi:hypothetical protein